MQVFMAAVIAALVAGFGSGFYVEHQINKAEIQHMELSIKAQNDNATALLKAKTDEVAAATANAIKSNSDLDASHEAFIKTAVAYDQQLDSVRLYTDSGTCRTGSAAASNRAGISENAASEAGLSEELDRLVKEKARIADEAADYADKAYQFATVNNCGIARPKE